MNPPRAIIAELRRSALEDASPTAGIGWKAWSAAYDFLGPYDLWWSAKPARHRLYFLLIAEAMERPCYPKT